MSYWARLRARAQCVSILCRIRPSGRLDKAVHRYRKNQQICLQTFLQICLQIYLRQYLQIHLHIYQDIYMTLSHRYISHMKGLSKASLQAPSKNCPLSQAQRWGAMRLDHVVKQLLPVRVAIVNVHLNPSPEETDKTDSIHMYIYIYIYKSVDLWVYLHVCIYTHIHIHVYIYTFIYIYMCI